MPRPLPPCPDCAADAALILRAVYRHYPPRPFAGSPSSSPPTSPVSTPAPSATAVSSSTPPVPALSSHLPHHARPIADASAHHASRTRPATPRARPPPVASTSIDPLPAPPRIHHVSTRRTAGGRRAGALRTLPPHASRSSAHPTLPPRNRGNVHHETRPPPALRSLPRLRPHPRRHPHRLLHPLPRLRRRAPPIAGPCVRRHTRQRRHGPPLHAAPRADRLTDEAATATAAGCPTLVAATRYNGHYDCSYSLDAPGQPPRPAHPGPHPPRRHRRRPLARLCGCHLATPLTLSAPHCLPSRPTVRRHIK